MNFAFQVLWGLQVSFKPTCHTTNGLAFNSQFEDLLLVWQYEEDQNSLVFLNPLKTSRTDLSLTFYRKNENKDVKVDDFLGAEDSLKVIQDSMVCAIVWCKCRSIYHILIYLTPNPIRIFNEPNVEKQELWWQKLVACKSLHCACAGHV